MYHALVDAERLAATWSALLQLGRDPARLDEWRTQYKAVGDGVVQSAGGPIFRRRSQATGPQRLPAASRPLEASKVTNTAGG